MHRKLKRNLVIALAALAVAAFAGGAYAATQSSGPSSRQAFLNDVAKRLHVTPQQLTSALNGAATDQIQAAVRAGKLTQAQANALEQRLKSGGPAPLLPLTPKIAPGPGGAGPRGFLAPGPGFGGGPLAFKFGPLGLGAAADYLGLTNMQLFQQLQSGKSLAQIAISRGKTVAGLEQAMTAPLKKALDAAVSRKAITAAREKQILDRFSSSLGQRVNQKGLAAAPGLKRGFFRGGPGHGWGPGPGYGSPSAPPNAPKNPAKPGALPQLFQPAPVA